MRQHLGVEPHKERQEFRKLSNGLKTNVEKCREMEILVFKWQNKWEEQDIYFHNTTSIRPNSIVEGNYAVLTQEMVVAIGIESNKDGHRLIIHLRGKTNPFKGFIKGDFFRQRVTSYNQQGA